MHRLSSTRAGESEATFSNFAINFFRFAFAFWARSLLSAARRRLFPTLCRPVLARVFLQLTNYPLECVLTLSATQLVTQLTTCFFTRWLNHPLNSKSTHLSRTQFTKFHSDWRPAYLGSAATLHNIPLNYFHELRNNSFLPNCTKKKRIESLPKSSSSWTSVQYPISLIKT